MPTKRPMGVLLSCLTVSPQGDESYGVPVATTAKAYPLTFDYTPVAEELQRPGIESASPVLVVRTPPSPGCTYSAWSWVPDEWLPLEPTVWQRCTFISASISRRETRQKGSCVRRKHRSATGRRREAKRAAEVYALAAGCAPGAAEAVQTSRWVWLVARRGRVARRSIWRGSAELSPSSQLHHELRLPPARLTSVGPGWA